MGVEDGQFFLSNGGFVPGFTQFGTLFTRPAVGVVPAEVREFSLSQNPSRTLTASK